jgi:hypothetical protein
MNEKTNPLQLLRDGYAERTQQERKDKEQTIKVNDVETERSAFDLLKAAYAKKDQGRA